MLTLLGAGIIAIVVVIFIMLGWNFFTAIGVGIAIIGSLLETYTISVPGYWAVIVLNELSHEQRVIFQGLNIKLPWETPGRKIDLRSDLSEVLGKDKPETYPTKDGRVFVKYVYLISPNVSDQKTAAENVLKWGSAEPDAIKKKGRALFSRTLSDFLKDMDTEAVIAMGKSRVNEEAFKGDVLTPYEKDHGANAEIVLEDIDRDPAIQKARDMIAASESYGEAMKKLKAAFPDLDDKEIKELFMVAEFKNVKKNINEFKGLENVTHFGSFGGMMGGDGGGHSGGDHK
ncbi:MAG: hypothetical protein V4486_00925 [Patescibacteria group bacterium]